MHFYLFMCLDSNYSVDKYSTVALKDPVQEGIKVIGNTTDCLESAIPSRYVVTQISNYFKFWTRQVPVEVMI